MSGDDEKRPAGAEAEAEAEAEAPADGAPLSPEEEEALRVKREKAKAKREKQKAKKKAEAAGGEGGKPQETEEERLKALEEIMAPRKKVVEPAKHNFWNTQPVMQRDRPFELGDEEGPVDELKKPSDVRQEPYDLSEGLEWWTPDVTKEEDLTLVYELLRDHYVEDDDCMFRFNYSRDFLLWALKPPKYFHDWHVAIRTKDEKKLVGFISGIPMTIRARKNVMRMCEINFLCVNKDCRAHGLAPLLIKEVTRRVNLKDIWQAVYTAGIVITSTISQCQYWHRSLDPEKLINIRFSRMPPSFEKFAKPMKQVKKHYALPDEPRTPGMRRMLSKDVKQVRQLLENYLSKFGMAPVFTNDEVKHWFLPREGVIDSYVVEKDGVVTNLCSFYTLPSTIIGGTKYTELRAAYCYYNVPSEEVPIHALMEDAMTLANKQGHDVFNALDIMDNGEIFKDLKFLIGDGHLRYYFYNWRFPELKPSKIGMVLL